MVRGHLAAISSSTALEKTMVGRHVPGLGQAQALGFQRGQQAGVGIGGGGGGPAGLPARAQGGSLAGAHRHGQRPAVEQQLPRLPGHRHAAVGGGPGAKSPVPPGIPPGGAPLRGGPVSSGRRSRRRPAPAGAAAGCRRPAAPRSAGFRPPGNPVSAGCAPRRTAPSGPAPSRPGPRRGRGRGRSCRSVRHGAGRNSPKLPRANSPWCGSRPPWRPGGGNPGRGRRRVPPG